MDSDFMRLARRVKALEGALAGTAAGEPARITGEMVLWPGSAALDGWLLCEGPAFSRIT